MEKKRFVAATEIVSSLPRKRCRRLRLEVKRTPWRDSFELERVGFQLCSVCDDDSLGSELQDIEEALATCQIWKARNNQRLPHAIDTSYSLALAFYNDYTGQSSKEDVRATLAMAILRGINGLADILQNGRREAHSVMLLCDQMGIPSWLVDIRHQSAHNQLPSLPVLRLAGKTLLGYLKERYWDELARKRKELRTKARTLLNQYARIATTNMVEIEIDKEDLDIPADDDLDDITKPQGNLIGAEYAWSGTNTNRYSVFEEPSKPKKKKKEEKKPVQPSRKTNNKDKGLGTPIEIAKAYVAEVSIDIGLQVVIASLIWGDTDGSSDADLLTLATTSENSAHCWSRYKPLLVILCKAWPGFLTMLLKEIVEYVLSTSGNVEGAKKELRPSILLSWFQFLLSKEFMIYMGLVPDEQDLMKKKQSEWTSQEKKEMGNPIPYEKLPNLPLENLYEQFTEEEDKTNETALQIRSLLGQILGHSATVVGPSLKTKQAEIPGAGNRDNSALDQERPLANSKCLWERVENWKPCDIGSLPSCPNSL